MTRRAVLLFLVLITLLSCGRPEKPVAKVAGKWISFDQWQVFAKTHGVSEGQNADNLKIGLEQLIRREVAFERGKRKGLLSGNEWESQAEKIKRNILVKNYVVDRYLQGKTEPDKAEIDAVVREEKTFRHIQGVAVKDLGAAKTVAEELRKGGDIKALFEKHRGEIKNGPGSFDLGKANITQLPPEIQKQFFSAKPGTVLDPVQFGEEGYIVPVLLELIEPDLTAMPDQNLVKKADTIRLLKAARKANDELKLKYPEAFDTALISNLLKNERPTEDELGKNVGTVGKDKIAYSLLLESYHSENQKANGSLPRTVEIFQSLFEMLVSERRIAIAAIDEGYLKKPQVDAQIWDYTQEMGSMKFMQDYMRNFVVKEETVKEYYESRKNAFLTSDRYHLRYLISGNPQALQNAMIMVKQGAPWEFALKAPGILPETGTGDLGWKNGEELKPVFSPRLMSMIAKADKGTWAADQIGPDKFGAFQVVDKEKGAPLDFEKAREDAGQRYLKENGTKILQDYLDGEGRKGLKIETFPQNLI
jgi:hypothetical protein